MRKVIFPLVVVFALIILAAPILNSRSLEYPLQDTQVYVDPVSISEPVDATFDVTVGIVDVVDLGGFGVIFGWDPTVLEYVSHTATPENVINPIVLTVADAVDAAAGTYELAAATLAGGGFDGSGTIFSLTLRVKAEGFSALEFLQHDLADAAAQAIPHTTVNGTFDNRPPVEQYELVIGVSGSGTTDPVPGTYLYDADTVVPVDAVPENGWILDYWLLDAVDVGSTDPYVVTMDANHTLTAVFVEAPVVQATIESSDSAGTEKNTFHISEEVYVTGTGYSPLTEYNLSIVEDADAWADGMTIPPRVPGTETTITSDANGDILVTLVWSDSLTIGEFDIIVDIDGDGYYTEGVDALDSDGVGTTAGFFVIPEFWLGTILGLGGCFAALGVLAVTKRKRPNNLEQLRQ
jgi:hypothetical protein